MSSFIDNPPHGSPPAAKAERDAARKAAKAGWLAAPAFPVASDPGLWGRAIAAAVGAASPLSAAQAPAQHGVPVFPVSPYGDKNPCESPANTNAVSRGYNPKPQP
jgi:hypothetical protein